MTYSTNPKKQRRYDWTDYRLEPYWSKRRPVRTRRTVLGGGDTVGVAYFGEAGEGPSLRSSWGMIAALLPCIVLWPIAIFTWKNDLTICRYDDKLELQPKHLIYSYRDRRDGWWGPRYESSVPYSLLQRSSFEKFVRTLL